MHQQFNALTALIYTVYTVVLKGCRAHVVKEIKSKNIVHILFTTFVGFYCSVGLDLLRKISSKTCYTVKNSVKQHYLLIFYPKKRCQSYNLHLCIYYYLLQNFKSC